MAGKHLVLDSCQTCGISLPMDKLYVCDCPCKKTMCRKDLITHARALHLNYHHLPEHLKNRRTAI